MAKTIVLPKETWDTFHSNGPFPIETLLQISHDSVGDELIDRYNKATDELQLLLKDSLDNGKKFSAYGSTWSMSNIAHSKHRMLHNANLNICMRAPQNLVHPQSAYFAENLFFFECGATIKEISEYLFEKGKSLKTCGASNGQTIAGAISTGVHGSAIDVGSIPDYVVGLQLLIGPNPEDRVYLERASRPAMSDDFAATLKARVVRDDQIFNAALVGLGAFGVIHGVVLEAEPLYLLKRYIKKIERKDAKMLANTMDFEHQGLRIKEETKPGEEPKRPFHFKYFINPYNDESIVTEYIFKIPYRTDYKNPIGLIKKSIYKDLPSMVAKFAAKFKCTIPMLVKELGKGVLGRVDSMSEGTLGQIFWDTDLKMAAVAGSFGVDHRNSSKVLDILIEIMNKKGPIPGLLAMRFVKGSEATLAFTRFPITCVIEVDCVQWTPNDNIISFDEFMGFVIDEFERQGIEYTLHWGKNAPWARPKLVRNMYGPSAEAWINIRESFLSPEMAAVFSNIFLETVGLYKKPVQGPIV